MATVGLFLLYVTVLNPLFGRAAVPSVTSSSATNIGQNSATLQGNITADGGTPVTEYGFEYGLTNSYGSSVSLPLNGGYQYQSQLGGFGFDDGQFLNPMSVGQDSAGNLYVVDAGNSRIQKFNSSGTYITQWGSNGSGNGQFSDPQSIAFDSSNNVYIADVQNNRIQKFNSSGTYITQWGTSGTGNGQFSSIGEIALDSSNNVYVIDQAMNRIQKFNSSGTYVSQWGTFNGSPSDFSTPVGMAIDSSNYVYLSFYSGNVQKFTSSGVYQSSVGTIGTGDGEFAESATLFLSVDSSNNLYVADNGLSRIQKFDSSGTYLAKFGSSGSGNGQFGMQFKLDVSSTGDIYVVDTYNHRVQYFADVASTGPITADVTSLNCETTYHFRAFATNNDGTSYGNDQTLTTGTCPALGSSVATIAADNISRTTASLNGITTDFGLKGITERGFEYGLTTGYGTTVTDTVSAGDSQIYELTGLTCNTTYNYRAYATNSQGSAYGINLTFTTDACLAIPTVTTSAASSLERYAATLNGSTSNYTTSEVTSRGFEYGLTTSYGTNVTDSTSSGNSQLKQVTGLQCNTTYHFRAFATNEAGTGYGTDSTFTTVDCRPDIDLQLTKTLTSAAPVQNGDPVTFHFELKNVGLQAIPYDDYIGQFIDVLPQEFTISPTFADQLGNDWLDCQYLGIGSASGNAYYQALYPNNGIMTCSLVSGTLNMATDAIIEFDIKGTANANFTSNVTLNRSLYVANTNVEEGFLDTYQAAIDVNDDIFALDFNNVSNYTYSGTSDNISPTVSVTAPTAGQSFAYGQTVDLTATSADTDGSIANLELFLDDLSIGNTTSSANLTLEADGLPSGTHTIYAEATDNDGVKVTSSLITFTVATAAPVVTTNVSLDATQNTADLKGAVTSIGSSTLTARGFQYGLNTSYGQTISEAVSATGGFTLTAADLDCATTYSYRAFATSAVGTVYGANQSITTDTCAGPPANVKTGKVKSSRLTSVSLTGSGYTSTDVGYGFQVGLTTSYGTTVNGATPEGYFGFSYSISGLTCGTMYHYRAFETNEYGTGYGQDETFFTADCQAEAEIEAYDAADITANSATVETQVSAGQEYLTKQGVNVYKDGSFVGGPVDNDRITAYAFAGNVTGDGESNGTFTGASKVQSDNQNNLYILNNAGDGIQKIDDAGDFVLKIESSNAFLDIAVTDTADVFALEYNQGTETYSLTRYNATGEEQQTYNIDSLLPFISGSGRGSAKIIVNNSGQLLLSVADADNAIVYTFDRTFNLVDQWDMSAPGLPNSDVLDWSPDSASLYDIATDKYDNLYVLIGENIAHGGTRIAKFLPDGTYLTQGGGQLGEYFGYYSYPTIGGYFSVDRNGSVWVGEYQFDQNLSEIRGQYRWDDPRTVPDGDGGTTVDYPADVSVLPSGEGYAIHFDSDNNIYVVSDNSVTKYQRITTMETTEWNLTSLQCSTTYEYEAYIQTSFDIFTSTRKSFTTSPCLQAPTVATAVASNISTTTGSMNGSVTSIGTSTLTARGFQYGATTSYGTSTNDFISATGSFSSALSGLSCGTSLHYRAYATNATGSGYGADQILTTSPCPGAPVVTTLPASAVGKVSGVLNGTVVSAGTSSISARGFQYGTSTNFGSTYKEATASTGAFDEQLSLKCGTTYYYRAYAVNSVGTTYGSTVQFKTGICELPPQVTITSPTNNQIFGASVTSVELSTTALSPTNKIDRIEFFVDGKLVGTATAAPYKVTALGLPAGAHTLIARAYDVLGVTTDAVPVKFFVDPATAATNAVNTKNTKNNIGFNFNNARRNWLDTLFGHRIFRWLPLLLIVLILLTAAYYGRLSYKEYVLRNSVQVTLKRYAETLRTTNDFLAISTHFLNTPVAILNGSTELLAAQKQVAASTVNHLKTRVKAFAASVDQIMVTNQTSATVSRDDKFKLNPKVGNPLKDKAVWLPLSIMFSLLVAANALLIYVNVLTNSLVRMVIELALFVLAGGLVVLSRRYKDLLIATRELGQKQLAKEAKLLHDRREFITSTHAILDQHMEALELAGQNLKDEPQAKLYFNGLGMLASLQHSMKLIEQTTDMDADAPLFAVTAYIRKLNKDFAAQAKKQGIHFTAEASEAISIRIQPQNFTQLVTSVVDNALRFTKDNGKVTVSARKRFRKIVVTVSDTGVGITADRLNELFQPFARATDTMQFDYDGAGLNLYVDKVIITRLGGTIDISSTEGKGTTVTMTFPAPGREESLLAPTTITPTALPGTISPTA